ncbi:MAG: hypothetical protein ACR2PO_14145 [Methyloligellaceae bacterium]
MSDRAPARHQTPTAAVTRATALAGAVACSIAAPVLVGCSKRDQAADLKATGYQPNGSYVLSESERKRGCSRLADTALLHLNDMKKHAKAERAARRKLPRTVISLFSRAVPVVKRPESEHAQRYRRDYAVVVAVNETLAADGCPTIDLRPQVEDDARLMGVTLKRQA